MPDSRPLPRHARHASLTLLILASGAGLAAAADAPADGAQLQRQIDELNARLKTLEHPAAPAAGASVLSGLGFGAYGEAKFGMQQNPDDDGHWQNGFDGARVTLLPSYQVTDRLLFKAEIEIEHGGLAFDADDKAGGALEVEQAYLDLTVNEYLHWRLPGIDVVPFGYTNLFHEPVYFYSVNRPELAGGLIPTTWFAGSTSIHGVLAGPVSYQLQVSSSLIDSGGHVSDTSDANGPADLGYEAGVSGSEALGLARPTSGDFKQQSNQLGYALRLAYQIPSVRGLAGSSSVYYSPDIEPRHAYASDAGNVRIGDLGSCALTMVDTELRYRPAQHGIELRAEAVGISFSQPRNLRANNDGDAENNVGRSMWGVSGEMAWHLQIPDGWELVPFYRYTYQVLQTVGFAGADDNEPTGAGRIQYHTFGLAAFPTSSVVLKIDYQAVRDGGGADAKDDHLLGGVGFFF
jgi:hypothetical protein